MNTIDYNRPNFYLYPVNNNRTAWRPFGLPVILVVPHKYDSYGDPIPNSMVFEVEIYIEDVPQEAFVVGHDNIGLRFPDRELYRQNLNSLDLADRIIPIADLDITRDGVSVAFQEAKNGDLINYTTSTGIVSTIPFIVGADYYDLSDVLLDIELLPPDNYNIAYAAKYYTRILSDDPIPQLLCISPNTISLALFKFGIQHPGEVLNEFYRHTPPPYLTNSAKSQDTTIGLYRPFTDILQDLMDEQGLLERINWVYDAPAEIIPYLSSLLGWDIPYFPLSLDKLRRAVLRRTVEFQNSKGSRRALINLFRLFGFEILISNLWWSSDGKRLIRPGVVQPSKYAAESIDLNEIYQIDIALNDYTPATINDLSISLIHRPQIALGLDNFKALQDGGDITVDAYAVTDGSEAYDMLVQIAKDIFDNPSTYGQAANCVVDVDGFINPTVIHELLSGLEIEGYSQILIQGKAGMPTKEILAGRIPPLISNGVEFNRETNKFSFVLNGYFEPRDNIKIFIFVTYSRAEVVVPSILESLQSNRFDLQVLTDSLQEYADPTALEFAIEFLYRLKAFHSILNVIVTRIDLNETYEVTDLCVGGEYTQRYDTTIGRLQVPPAIIPAVPTDLNDCSKTDPVSLGYKPEDLLLRSRKLSNMPEEYEVWRMLDDRETDNSDNSRLKTPQPAPDRTSSLFTYYGQDRITTAARIERKGSEFGPGPNANQNAGGNINSSTGNAVAGDFTVPGNFSANKDNGEFGAFTREYTDTRPVFAELDGVSDYCYKGRVDDELLYRPTLSNNEIYRSIPCSINMGHGVYWVYPTLSKIAIAGTINPAYKSRTNKIVFTGLADQSTIKYFTQGAINNQLLVDYNTKLPKYQNSMLGRLYRDYDTPIGETIHFDNRPGISISLNQKDHLALTRPNLEVQKPTLHLPGCRFPMMFALTSDYTEAQYEARPWDTRYSINCGPAFICGDNQPSYLNFYMQTQTDGNEYLIYDAIPYVVEGNGLLPDINSLSDNMVIGTVEDDIIHAVFSKGSSSNPAVVFEQMCDYGSEDDDYIYTNDPLFNSAIECQNSSAHYKDFIDGYPCLNGMGLYEGQDLGRSGLYDDVLTGLGIDLNPDLGTQPQYLFTLGSGIRSERGMRLDCGCTVADCEDMPTSEYELQTICGLSQYLDDNEYDWNMDQLNTVSALSDDERMGVEVILLNGQVGSLIEII